MMRSWTTPGSLLISQRIVAIQGRSLKRGGSFLMIQRSWAAFKGIWMILSSCGLWLISNVVVWFEMVLFDSNGLVYFQFFFFRFLRVVLISHDNVRLQIVSWDLILHSLILKIFSHCGWYPWLHVIASEFTYTVWSRIVRSYLKQSSLILDSFVLFEWLANGLSWFVPDKFNFRQFKSETKNFLWKRTLWYQTTQCK